MKKDTHTYASLLQRFIALVIDSGLSISIQVALIFYLSLSQARSFEDFVVKIAMYWFGVSGLFIIPMLYLYFYCIEKFGGTPGKIISGLQIIDYKGAFLSKKDAFFREMVYKPISYAPFGFGVWVAAKHPQKQTWHDEMAGTFVVQKENKLMLSLVVAVCIIALAVYLSVFIYNLGLERGLY